ncbi:MAG: hypothetical protein JRS35_20440 [Deltaproteobacteria bacterium]|nr:hypothetical protein [Deltaproteobacteria bacterium]
MASDLSEFDFTVKETRALSEQERRELFRLFELNYRQANPVFLEKSLATLRHAAMAFRDGLAVGFGVAETRVMDLPRLPAQLVTLAGICCIAPEFRRRGLFGKLELLAMTAEAVPEKSRRLACGRMAHPAAMRSIARFPKSVPRPGVRPTAWQQEVGSAIAEAYGVRDFDPETFVCIGSGTPTGYPRIEFEVEPHEWEVFEPVDRDRGDALLAIAWVPDPPQEW